jgi:hypothetical protein
MEDLALLEEEENNLQRVAERTDKVSITANLSTRNRFDRADFKRGSGKRGGRCHHIHS